MSDNTTEVPNGSLDESDFTFDCTKCDGTVVYGWAREWNHIIPGIAQIACPECDQVYTVAFAVLADAYEGPDFAGEPIAQGSL